MAEEGKTYLRDLWYFGALSSELGAGGLLGKELLGEPIALARGRGGTAFALRNICPHRGTLLSTGKVVEGPSGAEMECPYHGWRFGREGACTAIPSLTAAQTAGMDLAKIRTRAYPVHEAQGIIWVYLGERAEEAPALAPPAIALVGEALPKLSERMTFSCHVDHAVIGLMDPAHIPYIHRQWWWRTAGSVHDKEKRFGPVERGFSMLPHRPSSNSFAYKILGGAPETEIRFQLPGLRTEIVKTGRRWVVSVTCVTPVNAQATEVTQIFYWDHPVFGAIPRPLIRWAARTFLGQDRDAVNAQQVGLSYEPRLMLIHDADVQAKWYYRLKDEWAESRRAGRPFENPVRETTLRWRS